MPSRIYLLEEPSETDVLCGRGNIYSSRPGNIKFQQIICDNIGKYSAAQGRPEKVDVVDDVLKQIFDSGTRIKKLDAKRNLWYELSHSDAHQKVGHCLRDTIRTQRRKQKKNANNNNDDAANNNSSRKNKSSVAIQKQRNIRKQKERQARTVLRHQPQYYDNNDHPSNNDNNVDDKESLFLNNIESNDDIIDFVFCESKYQHRLSLLADWSDEFFSSDDSDHDDNDDDEEDAGTAGRKRLSFSILQKHNPVNVNHFNRHSISLFDDEFPESNMDFSPSSFFGQ